MANIRMSRTFLRRRFSRLGLSALLAIGLVTGLSSAVATLEESSQELCVPSMGLDLQPQIRVFTTQEEITRYLNCTIVYQEIRIISPTLATLDLTPVTEFKYGLSIISSPNLQTITAPNLKLIGQEFILDNLPSLKVLDLPNFTSAGAISWISLPKLRDIPSLKAETVLTLFEPVESGLGDVRATSRVRARITICRTALARVDFFRFEPNGAVAVFDDPSISTTNKEEFKISISQNPNLETISLDLLQNGISSLEISQNHPTCQLSMQRLTTVGSLTLQHLSAVSFPSLTTITGTLTLSRTNIAILFFPRLENVHGSMLITRNPALRSIRVPLLRSSYGEDEAGVQIHSNPLLEDIVIPKLEQANVVAAILHDAKQRPLNPHTLEKVTSPSLVKRQITTIDAIIPTPTAISTTTPTHPPAIPSPATPTSTPFREPEKNALTGEVAGVLIAVAVAVLVGIVGFSWWRRRIMLRTREAERDANGLELAESGRRRSADGVVRADDTDGDGERPPAYSRLPKPGEVPPDYREVVLGLNGAEREVVRLNDLGAGGLWFGMRG